MKKSLVLTGASALLLFGLAGCGSNNKDASDNSNNDSKEEQEQGKENEKNEDKDKEDKDDGGALETKDFKVSYKQAVDDFNKNNKDTKLVEVSLKHSDIDDYKYHVYGIKANDIYREKINANDGKEYDTHSLAMDKTDKEELPKETFTLNGIKDPKEAMTAAMKGLKDKYGLDAGHVAEWKLVKQDGKVVYEIRVRHILREYHITLDAKTLAVLSTVKEFY